MNRVLVIEDDKTICELLKHVFKSSGYHSIIVNNANKGIHALETMKDIDLIVLDLGLPDISGWDFLRILKQRREISNIPVVIITGQYKKTPEIVKALELGADDYILKPFSPRILIARIKAILRRFMNGSKPPQEIISTPNEEIKINMDTREVFLCPKGKKEQLIKNLTNKEFELLVLFIRNYGRIFSRKYLFETIWDMAYPGPASRAVDKQIERLRSKLKIYGKCIKTVQGIGYQFTFED